MRARLAAIGSTPGSHPLRALRAPAGVSNCEVEVSISPDAFLVTYLRAARHRSAVWLAPAMERSSPTIADASATR